MSGDRVRKIAAEWARMGGLEQPRSAPPSTRIDGEAFLLEAACGACNREADALMCALCEALTVAEMYPTEPPAVLAGKPETCQ